MVNKLLAVILVIALHLVMNYLLPWWNISIAAALTVFILKLGRFSSWMLPALSLSTLWGVWMLILDQKTGFFISERVALIFDGKGFISYLIPILGCFIVSSLSGLIAYLIKSSFQKIEKQSSDDNYQMVQPDLGNKKIEK